MLTFSDEIQQFSDVQETFSGKVPSPVSKQFPEFQVELESALIIYVSSWMSELRNSSNHYNVMILDLNMAIETKLMANGITWFIGRVNRYVVLIAKLFDSLQLLTFEEIC